MKSPEIEPRYPVAWPMARKHTDARKPALFRDGGNRLSLTAARRRLREQTSMMTSAGEPWRVTNMVLSMNIRFTASGARDQNISRRDPADPGVAFYFDLDGRPHILACDQWDTVADNIAAIAAHIDALRGQERWGVADLRPAFAGHVALPSPDQWWTVLGVPQDATIAAIDAAYRSKAKEAHPNAGGDRAAWDRLSSAYAKGKAARSR